MNASLVARYADQLGIHLAYFVKILLIDDHTSFCEGLVAALTSVRSDFSIDFESDAELVPASLVGRSDYDLFIFDLVMPGIGGIELIRYLNTNRNLTPIIVMSSVQDSSMIKEVYDLGAVGYLPKSYGIRQIVDAIDGIQRGEVHVPAALAPILDSSISIGETSSVPTSVKLTKRQIEILSLMDRGLGNQEIADKLFISKATVKTHINHLFRELGVNNRINCLREAKRTGVLVAH